MTERDTLAQLRLDDGRLWIDVAADFQIADAIAVTEGPKPYNFLTRARGGSKTTDLAAVALALMLAVDTPERLYWIAADAEQGRLAIDSISQFGASTPSIGSAIEIQARKVVSPQSGASLEVLAADAAGAWGLRPYAVFADELAQWPDTPQPRQLWEAVSTAVAKNKRARLVVLTTSGDPAHFSAEILEHAKTSPLWRVHEVPGPAPWADPDRLAEQRARLTESAYARLFENQWTEPEDRLTSVADLEACATLLDWPLGYSAKASPYLVTIDIGLKNDRTVVAVTHGERTPGEGAQRIVLDRLASWQGSRQRPVSLDEVEAYVLQVAHDYHAQIRLDPYQAAQLAQRLRRHGVRVEEFVFSASSVGKLGQGLYTTLRDHALAIPRSDHEDPEAAALHDELASVRLRETSPGVYRLDHDRGRHDDRAIVLALAVDWFREHGSRLRWGFFAGSEDREDLHSRGLRVGDDGIVELDVNRAREIRDRQIRK